MHLRGCCPDRKFARSSHPAKNHHEAEDDDAQELSDLEPSAFLARISLMGLPSDESVRSGFCLGTRPIGLSEAPSWSRIAWTHGS